MSQYSLFNAAVYVQKAYDQLVLAHEAHDSKELDSLKWQMLQAWLSLQQARLEAESTAEALQLEGISDEAPF